MLLRSQYELEAGSLDLPWRGCLRLKNRCHRRSGAHKHLPAKFSQHCNPQPPPREWRTFREWEQAMTLCSIHRIRKPKQNSSNTHNPRPKSPEKHESRARKIRDLPPMLSPGPDERRSCPDRCETSESSWDDPPYPRAAESPSPVRRSSGGPYH